MPSVRPPSDSPSRVPGQVVRTGYNRISSRYLLARSQGAADLPLLSDFAQHLRTNALVLDVGCGAGVPVTQALIRQHRVVGIDFSIVQVRLAAQLNPSALFSCQDMTQLAFPSASFDGICSFYAILHVPRSKHEALLTDLHCILKTPGYALLCLGAEDNEADYAPYLGVRMFWSHYNTDIYLAMLARVGFELITSRLVPDPIDGTGSHLFALARKRGA